MAPARYGSGAVGLGDQAVWPPTVAVSSAAVAGLIRSDPRGAGIGRGRLADGFHYVPPSGTDGADAENLARIRALAIPPAWTNVWISPDPLGHIQADTDAKSWANAESPSHTPAQAVGLTSALARRLML